MILKIIDAKKQNLFVVNIVLILIFIVSSIQPIISQPVSTIAITSISKFSNTSILDDIYFSSDIGNIREVHKFSNNISGKQIILIQDAHCNYEAQKNIYEIIKHITENNKVKLIALEGAKGYINTEKIKSSLNINERKKITNTFLNDGILTASEAFSIDYFESITTDIFGVEDKDLYLKNFKAFHDVIIERNETFNFLNDLTKIIDTLKIKIFNDDLNLLFQEEKKHLNTNNVQLKQEVKWILDCLNSEKFKSLKNDLLIKENSPNFKRFINIMTDEEKMDYKKIIQEEDLFYLKAKEMFSKNDYDKCMTHFFNYKTKTISDYNYYKGILKFEEISQKFLDSCSNFFKYTKIQTQYKEIHIDNLINEIDLIKESLKLSLADNEQQKELIYTDKKIKITEKLINLKATLFDYRFFKNHESDFNISKILKFVDILCSKNQVSFPFYLKGENTEVNKALEAANLFYYYALERDEILTANLLDELKKSNEEVAIFITGGFHTAGIVKILEKHNIDYAVISPNIKQEFSSERYFNLMDIQRNNVKDLMLTLPVHLAPVLLLDSGIFDENIKNTELNKLKLLLKVNTQEDLRNANFNIEKLSEDELADLLKEIQRLRLDIAFSKNSPAKIFIADNLDFLESELMWMGVNQSNQNDIFLTTNTNVTTISDVTSIPQQNINNDLNFSVGEDTMNPQTISIQNDAVSNSTESRIITENIFDDFFSRNTTSSAISPKLKNILSDIIIFLKSPTSSSDENIAAYKIQEKLSNIELTILLEEIQRLRLEIALYDNSSLKSLISKKLNFLESILIKIGFNQDDSDNIILENTENGLTTTNDDIIIMSDEVTEGLNYSIGEDSIDVFNDTIKPNSITIDEQGANQNWNAKKIDDVFNKFFSGESSSYTTSSTKESILPDIIKFLKLPPPSSGENILTYNIGEKVLGNLEIIIDSIARKNLQIIGYDPDNDKKQLLTDFYLNFRRLESEAAVLKTLRQVLSKVRREKMMDSIKSFNFESSNLTNEFSSLVKTLVQTIIEKEKDSLRDIRWKYKDTYLQNLNEFEYGFKVLEAKKAKAFAIDKAAKEVLFNKEILKILSDLKNIDLKLKFTDDRIVLTNMLATYLIGTLEHEIRGHFKHNTSNEQIAFREQGSRYGILNFATSMLFSAFFKWQMNFPSIEPNSQIIKVIARETIQGHEERDELPSLIVSNKKMIINMFEQLIDIYMQYVQKPEKMNKVIPTPVAMFPKRYDYYWDTDPGKIQFRNNFEKFSFSSAEDSFDNATIHKWNTRLKDEKTQNELFSAYKKIDKNNNTANFNFEEALFIAINADLLNKKLNKVIKDKNIDIENLKVFINSLEPSELWIFLALLNRNSEKLINVFSEDFNNLMILKSLIDNSTIKDLILHKVFSLIQAKLAGEINNNYINYDHFVNFIDFKIFNNLGTLLSSTIKTITVAENFFQNHSKTSNLSKFIIGIGNSISESGVDEKTTLFQELYSFFSSYIPNEFQKKYNWEQILNNNRIIDFQRDEIYNFFSNNIYPLLINENEVPKQLLNIFNLILLNIFEVYKIINGKLTKNEKNMIIEGLIDALQKEFNFDNNMKEKFTSTVKQTISHFSLKNTEDPDLSISKKLKLKLEILKSLSDIMPNKNSYARIRIENNNIIFNIGEKTFSISKDEFISEDINDWIKFDISSLDIDIITFINIISELFVQKEETLLLSEVYEASSNQMFKKINIIIEKDSSKTSLDSIVNFLKILSKDNNTKHLTVIGSDSAFIKSFLNENGLSNIAYSNSLSKKHQGIVIGSGNFFNQTYNELSTKKIDGYFFLDNFDSLDGALLMALAFATQNEKIVDHLKKQSKENAPSKILSIWNILKDFDKNSKTIIDKMPAIKPILKYLLKHLASEKFTLLNAA